MSANKLVALTLCAAFSLAASVGNADGGGGNTLSFHNTHTGESITANPDQPAPAGPARTDRSGDTAHPPGTRRPI